jgi:hypothetical protein
MMNVRDPHVPCMHELTLILLKRRRGRAKLTRTAHLQLPTYMLDRLGLLVSGEMRRVCMRWRLGLGEGYTSRQLRPNLPVYGGRGGGVS